MTDLNTRIRGILSHYNPNTESYQAFDTDEAVAKFESLILEAIAEVTPERLDETSPKLALMGGMRYEGYLIAIDKIKANTANLFKEGK